MKKKFRYFYATTDTNGVISTVAFRTSLPLQEIDVKGYIELWGRLRFGLNLEVYDIFPASYKEYKFITTKIDW